MDYKETYEKILGEYRQVFERVDQDNMRAFIDEVKAHDRIFLIVLDVKVWQPEHLLCD